MSIFKRKIKVKASDFSHALSSLVIGRSGMLAEDEKFIEELELDHINPNRLYIELSIIFCFLVSDVFLRYNHDEALKKNILDDMYQQVLNYIYTALNKKDNIRASLQKLFKARYEEYHTCFSNNKNWIREFSKLCIENITDNIPDGEISIMLMSAYITYEYTQLPKYINRFKLIV